VRPELFPVKWILHGDKTHLMEKSSSRSRNRPFCIWLLFHTIINHLVGSHFETMENIKKVIMAILKFAGDN
jgi:hypothetical protein